MGLGLFAMDDIVKGAEICRFLQPQKAGRILIGEPVRNRACAQLMIAGEERNVVIKYTDKDAKFESESAKYFDSKADGSFPSDSIIWVTVI